VKVRPLRADEGRLFLEIHAASIRGLAANHYPPEVIDAWQIPATENAVRRLMENPDREIRLVAELDGEAVGIGALVLETSELRACYVAPHAARRGCGAALVREIERLARDNGLTGLELAASVNAEPFYRALGYEVRDRGEHVLRTGHRMAAVMMAKSLA
jgi:putative acetyltransferase